MKKGAVGSEIGTAEQDMARNSCFAVSLRWAEVRGLSVVGLLAAARLTLKTTEPP